MSRPISKELLADFKADFPLAKDLLDTPHGIRPINWGFEKYVKAGNYAQFTPLEDPTGACFEVVRPNPESSLVVTRKRWFKSDNGQNISVAEIEKREEGKPNVRYEIDYHDNTEPNQPGHLRIKIRSPKEDPTGPKFLAIANYNKWLDDGKTKADFPMLKNVEMDLTYLREMYVEALRVGGVSAGWPESPTTRITLRPGEDDIFHLFLDEAPRAAILQPGSLSFDLDSIQKITVGTAYPLHDYYVTHQINGPARMWATLSGIAGSVNFDYIHTFVNGSFKDFPKIATSYPFEFKVPPGLKRT